MNDTSLGGGHMTEYDYSKLVAVVARVISHAYDLDPEDDAWEAAKDVLRAIDASGLAWVAPWEPTAAMDEAVYEAWSKYGGSSWQRARDACLAERRGDGR